MQFFFTGSIRGGREQQPQFEYIINELERYGNVFWEHTASKTMPQVGETGLSGKEILLREKEKIDNSDVIIAEVTTASLWVGYLISYATSKNKKVVALYNKDSTLKLSAIIKWDDRVKVYTYETQKDIEVLFEQLFTGK